MGKITVYYSSATADLGVKKNQQSLKFLLDEKKISYEEEDMAQMDKAKRDEIYNLAATKTIPFVFNDGKFIGTYETLQDYEEDEKLDSLLK